MAQAHMIAVVAKDAYAATEQVVTNLKNFAKHMEEWLQVIREKQDFYTEPGN